MSAPNFNSGRPAAKLTPEEWEQQARRRGPTHELDPHGMPTKDLHVRFNAWEHEHLQILARRDCSTLQRLIRSAMRKVLFDEFGG